ncbi:hypothetical protein J2X72_001370 [Phyllobacterium sp. 1468]|uniref:KAP family P-loop NTPase fold protein n=1 Tax=Phyllobacterium sp. 1468 TaxID=2817759 RepID=UPI0028564662|nr:P-loop NTPase fold protein [Phyllobacterium sp. 1468]MDR6632586.1 hypothetical protein [Phyllobacterium sp. 1468]
MFFLRSMKQWWFAGTVPLAKPVEAEIGSDVPIRTASQDLLRRVPFAERVSEILCELNLDEGRVFALRGPWGAGKSSLKNLVIEQLNVRPNGANWLEFNPWQWGEGDAISKALFKQIADKLGGPLSSAAGKRASIFRRYGTVLTGSGASLKKAGGNTQLIATLLTNASVLALVTSIGLELPTVATIAAVLAGASMVVPVVGQVMLYFGQDRWSEPLDRIRAALEKSLRELEKPLVVFVDDIDRLEPDQIRLLFRQIKVNANLPNIVFVLLFQSSIVEAALDPIADNQGREFLKKIVQANFDLPAVSKSMVHEVMTGELNRVAGAYATPENGFEGVRWGNALNGAIQPFISNLRDARRYLSSVSIHMPLHIGKNVMEVNVIDFLCLEVLRVFESSLHTTLFAERDLLLQAGRFNGDRENESHRARMVRLIEGALEDNRPAVEAAIRLLFPRTEWAFGGSHFGDDWNSSWNSAKRVCSPRFFPTYFELQTPSGEISENEFNDLIAVSGDTAKLQIALQSIEQRDLLASLAGRMDDSVDRLPIGSASILLPAMFTIAQKLVGHHSEQFSSAWVSAWRAVSWYIDRLPQGDRGQLTLAALNETGALSVGAIIIHLNDPASQEEGSRIDPKLDEVTVSALKVEWLRQINEMATNSSKLLDESDLGSWLYRWRDYSGSLDAPRSWVQSVIQTDKGFADLMTQLMTIGTSHTVGDLVSSRVDRIDEKTIEDFVGIRDALQRLSYFTLTELSPKQERAINALRKTLQEQDSGGTPWSS